jgi:hypothetical protein
MIISYNKLYNIINYVYDNSKNSSSIEEIYKVLSKQFMLPIHSPKKYNNFLFISKQAEDLASYYNLILEPGTGTAMHGKFTVNDIQNIQNKNKSKNI